MKKFVAVMFGAFLFLQVISSDLMAQELQYKVKAGDSLWTIAQNHGISVDYLKKVNDLRSDFIQIGDILNIGTVDPTPAVSSRGTAAGPEAGCYKVKAGDSLWTIAQNHGISVDYLKKVNYLRSDFIQIGDILNIGTVGPAPAASSRGTAAGPEAGCYKVKAGDSLYKIALNHGITVEMLKQANDLSSTIIYPGQELLINSRTAVPSRAGTIVRADQVLAKAAEYLGTPYKYGGQGPGGFDCSGFVSYIFGQFGYKLPHNAASQANLGIAVNKNELLPGDLVFFDGNTSHINHVGIYAGNAQFIHSSSPRSGGVIYSSLNEAYYARGYVSARRIIR